MEVKLFESACNSKDVFLFNETNKDDEKKCGRFVGVCGAIVATGSAIHFHHHVHRLIEFFDYAHRTHETKSAKRK